MERGGGKKDERRARREILRSTLQPNSPKIPNPQHPPKPLHLAMTDFGISESGPELADGMVNSRRICAAFWHSERGKERGGPEEEERRAGGE